MAKATEYITIDDFTPGIFGAFYQHGYTPTPEGHSISQPGAAVMEGTYRCGADLTGSLVPLPALAVGKTASPPGVITDYPSGQPWVYQVDAFVRSKVNATTTESPDPWEVFVHWYFCSDVDVHGTFRVYSLTRLYREWEDTPNNIDVALFRSADQSTFPYDVPSANFASWLMELVANQSYISSMTWVMETAYTNRTGLRAVSGGAISANVQAITTYDSHETNYSTALTGGTIATYPRSADLDDPTPSFTAFDLQANARLVAVHQGRIVVLVLRESTGGAGNDALNDALAATDQLRYWAATIEPSGSYSELWVGEENTIGVGVMASVSADELLLIKHNNGGYIIRGDLDVPTVSRLPFIESTYGLAMTPAYTPFGLVYGSRNGVYLWTGGETSEKLSVQLDGFFWDHTRLDQFSNYGGHRARFAYWAPYVCVPNNFLYDTRHKSWWRIDEPIVDDDDNVVPFNIYCVNPYDGRLFAFPYLITETQTNVWYEATMEINKATSPARAGSYSWKSQPLATTRNRMINVTELRLMTTSQVRDFSDDGGTVAITLSGFGPDGQAVTPVTTTFTLTISEDMPQILVKDIVPNFQAAYVQVRIEASAEDGYAAPKVHSVDIGIADRARIAKS